MVLPRRGLVSKSPRSLAAPSSRSSRDVVGLFAGIGGIEVGLHDAGFASALLCDVEPTAQRVLSARFPECPLVGDIAQLVHLPSVEVLAAGFPCQDLSQAGRTAGISGSRSGLVGHVFRLLGSAKARPRWLLLENVPFMLQLDQGKAMAYLATQLEALGLMWAYRVVDARAFGLPQRRLRVILLASATEDPRDVLFADEAEERVFDDHDRHACGFYWTEGTRGLGWAVNAVPTLKGGSTIGIPSPPAIRLPSGEITTPDLRDAERLQGFPADWTLPAIDGVAGGRIGSRWKLVGNAVSVPVARWIGEKLSTPGKHDGSRNTHMPSAGSWPVAAWGTRGERHAVRISTWPRRAEYQDLGEFLRYEGKPLSAKATAGFLSRARSSTLRFVEGFLDDVEEHLDRMRTRESKSSRRAGVGA